MDLAEKTALVTGAAHGIGKATAMMFARGGARVAALDLEQEDVDDVVAAIRSGGGEALAVAARRVAKQSARVATSYRRE